MSVSLTDERWDTTIKDYIVKIDGTDFEVNHND